MQAWDVDQSALAAFHRFLMRVSSGEAPLSSKRADEALRGELPRDQMDWALDFFEALELVATKGTP